VYFSAVKARAHRFGRVGLPRIIGVLALAGALASCSAVKTLYNQAPDLAYWYLDGYVDFNGEQSLQVKSGLERLQAWHRQTQLPAYVDILRRLQDRMPGNLSPAQACQTYADVRSRLVAVSAELEPTAAAVAATVSASQLRHMEKRFAKSNAEFREDFLDGSARELRERRLKKALKRAEMLYGDLQDAQKAALAQAIDQSPFNSALTYQEWQRRQQDVLRTLRGIAGSAGSAGSAAQPNQQDETRKAMRGLIERTIRSPDAAYRTYEKALTEQSCQGFAALHNTTTPAQRSKAVETLRGYEEDFRILTGTGKRPERSPAPVAYCPGALLCDSPSRSAFFNASSSSGVEGLAALASDFTSAVFR
jgi:hypothetical protein